MKAFHKQLILYFLFFSGVFGCAIYFVYDGVTTIVRQFSERSVVLIADNFKHETSELLVAPWESGTEPSLLRSLKSISEDYPEIQDLFLLDANGAVFLALNQSDVPADSIFAATNGIVPPGLSDDLRVLKNQDAYFAVWRKGNVGDRVIIKLDPQNLVHTSLHSLTVRYYLLGFSGILAVIFLAMLSSKFFKPSLKGVKQVFSNIEKRKYGYRVKAAKEDEFSDIYEKANAALQRMEQLDSAQRSAVRRKNVLANEVKTISRFMDMMAHEVRNPLHSFGLNLDVLKTKIQKGQTKKETLKHVRILENESEHLKEVVQGFLSYVRPGVPQKERLQINAVLKEVCESLALEAKSAEVKIETRLSKGLREVMIDRRQFQQAVHNVVINALHATGPGGKITVRSWSKRKQNLVSIKDTGTGIEKEALQKIFDLYYTTKKSGSGIGLPLTKRIIEANGGEVQLESEPGKGTTVTFMFPTL